MTDAEHVAMVKQGSRPGITGGKSIPLSSPGTEALHATSMKKNLDKLSTDKYYEC